MVGLTHFSAQPDSTHLEQKTGTIKIKTEQNMATSQASVIHFVMRKDMSLV